MLAVMSDEVSFAPGLFRGTAGYYDRFRLPYPATLTGDLTGRTAPSGTGRLLDLACGTGQLAFALSDSFAEVWAVDSEPDMIKVIRSKSAAAGLGHIRPVIASAEDLRAPAGSFELIVVGNAFHRLRRDAVARLAREWLRPGGFLALCWSSSPQSGSRDWQQAFRDLLQRWMTTLGTTGRIPANWEVERLVRPDADILSDAGFEPAGRFEFEVEHRWTPPELAGWVRSTSFLPAPVLGSRAVELEAELAAVLGPYASGGAVTEAVSFSYELARRAGVGGEDTVRSG